MMPKANARKIGIMGGTFNPVHSAHLMIADYIAQKAGLDEVWLMVTPLNPLKTDRKDIAADNDRLAMVDMACRRSKRLWGSNFEFDLPRPSYTVDTLAALREAYPEDKFTLIIGSDNWNSFDRWRKPDEIIAHHNIIIYPRPGDKVDIRKLPFGVTVIEAPQLDVSSSFIREAIASGLDMSYFMPQGVAEYIVGHGLYGTDKHLNDRKR